MKYRKIPGIDKALSALTYGTPWTATKAQTRAEAFRSYDLAWEAGFRCFDTAHSYGEGEETLGLWLTDRKHRSEAVLLDKGCNPGQQGSPDVMSAATIREQLTQSLQRLKTDCVEIYVLHRDDASVPVDEIIEELNQLKKEGKLLIFGASNWTFERIQTANAFAQAHGLESFSAFSPAYSLAEYIRDPWGGSVALSGEAAEPYRNWLKENRMPVFCYSSLGRGYLSGKFRTDSEKPIEECIGKGSILEYDAPVNRARLSRAEKLAEEKGVSVSQICLAWLLKQPLELFPIVAPTSEAHIADNVAALDIDLTDAECEWLEKGCDHEL